MSVPSWVIVLSLFLVAVVARLIASSMVVFPHAEGSAYYVDVARNLVEGHGLVSDAVWSYATPPLVAPKPAFELWLPMATFVAAIPMAILGTSFASAQLGGAILGALVAPLAWAIGREAADAHGLDSRRTSAVAIASGLLVAVLGPFLVAVAGPDSTTPFLVFGTLAAWLMPRALRSTNWLPGLALGVALALAWLSRQEAAWLGAAYLVMLAVAMRHESGRVSRTARLLAPTVIGGLIVVGPWLIRNALTFGSPLPSQVVDNALLRRSTDIFAWLDQPTVEAFLAQGPAVIVGNQLAGVAHNLVSVLLVPAFPLGIAGLVALLALRRSPALRQPTGLQALLLSGALTFLVTSLVFPVATLSGTFLHASGPLLVGLAVCAALGGDALMARVSRMRGWPRPNVIVAPIALIALVVSLAALQVAVAARQASEVGDRVRQVAIALDQLGEVATADGAPARPTVLMSDHPMWLADATGQPVIALPDEAPDAVADLADHFDAAWLVVFDEHGRYPDALLTDSPDSCLAARPQQIGPTSKPAYLFRLNLACGRS